MVTETITTDSNILRRVDYDKIIDEIVVTLRNSLTDRQSRTESTTDTFVGDGSATRFELTNDLDSKSRHKLMNITSVTVDGTAQTNYTSYIAGYSKDDPDLGFIRFWNSPSTAEAIIVNYDWRYSFIYTEDPRLDLSLDSYPMISVQIRGKPSEAGCGGKSTKHEITITIVIVDIKRNYVENIINEISTFFVEEDNKKGFHNFQYIFIDDISDIVPSSDDLNDIVYGAQVKLIIPFEYEFSR